MATKRELKRGISYLFEDLLMDLLISQQFIPNVDKSSIERIMLHIGKMNNEFISRAHHFPKKGNRKVVKQYRDKFFSDLDLVIEGISKDIEALNP